MAKKNLTAEVTVRVLGKELTKAEAEELYMALGQALGKSPVIQYIYRDRWNMAPQNPYWNLIGEGLTKTTSNPSPSPDPYKMNYCSSMVEKLVN